MKIGTLAMSVMFLALSAVTQSVEAQELKFAHIDSQKLLTELPSWQKAEEDLKAENSKLEDQMKIMSNELQQKYTQYVQQRDSLPDLIRATREKELQDTQERIQSFGQLAQQSLQQKEQALMAPIITALEAAIKSVAEEGKYIYVFDTSSQVILYHSEQSHDISAQVLAKMK